MENVNAPATTTPPAKRRRLGKYPQAPARPNGQPMENLQVQVRSFSSLFPGYVHVVL